MDTKVKRKYGNKKNKSLSVEKSLSVPTTTTTEISKLEGVEKLILSPLTQQILECRVGVNITLLEPWIYVKKETIIENIELHENSSEFLPIKDEIICYPDERIFVGCYGHEQDKPEEFLVCTTVEVLKNTLETLEAQEVEQHKKIVESIVKVCGTWISLGSEVEIDENMTQVLRKLFVVNLNVDALCFFVPKKFDFRFVEQAPDGYVELLSPRQTFNNVFRRRISFQVQSSASKRNVFTQTVLETVVNKTTMCPTTMIAKKLEIGAMEQFIAKIDEKHLFDILQTNYFMDLCNDDFLFQNAISLQRFQYPHWVLSFQDIFNCRGKKVSCLSWNAMKSGLVAVSYVNTASSMIVNNNSPYNSIETEMEEHFILIWSYTDVIRPHLYLHCSREVTVVSFCLYNANIVVGGCDNGQIVVWDISGRMEQNEKTKIRTRQQQEHLLILEYYMMWMKKTPSVQHVFPVIASQINVSHISPITYIKWLPYGQLITKNGHFEKRKDNDVRLQFLTCSKEGGRIDIWDIGVPEGAQSETKTKRSVRLRKMPPALTKYESPLKALANRFIPVFRIWVSNPDTHKPLIMNKLLERNENFSYYKAINPETENSIYERTYFKLNLENEDEVLSEQKYICTTAFGEVCSIQWDGLDYNQGCQINSNIAEVSSVKLYHDGPIVTCMESPIIKNLFLTVGGRVFAIWNINNEQQVPLFWRKSPFRYMSGTWMSTQPFQISLIRNDTFKEIWDLMEDSKNALTVMKNKGFATDSVYNDFRRMHTKKGTFARTNTAGEVNIYFVAKSCMNVQNKEINRVLNYLLDLELNREKLLMWINAIKSKFHTKEEKIEEEEAAAETILLPNQDDIAKAQTTKPLNLQTNKWQAKEEAYMRKILFGNKHMKVDQIIKNSVLIRELEEARKKNMNKFAEKVKLKDIEMKAWKTRLIPEHQFTKKNKITVSFCKDMAEYMKQSYIQNYKDIEEETIIKINRHHYRYSWPKLNKRFR